MKFRYLFLLVCVLGTVLFLKAQNPYHLMLDTLYSKSVPFISISELKRERQSSPVILDTRTIEEYEVSHIKGAEFVDYDNFSIEPFLELPKNQTIILYCSVGYRSEKIGEKFLQHGFTSVRNLYGGIFEWINQGQEIVNSEDKFTKEIHAYDKHWGIWLKNGIKIYE